MTDVAIRPEEPRDVADVHDTNDIGVP